MFHLTRPDPNEIESELVRAGERGFNYDAIGATRGDCEIPEGFVVDRWGGELGRGARVFEAARRAIESFRMYPPGWTEVIAPDGVAPGSVFGALFRHFGFWSLNPCRIIDVVSGPERHGFTLGTLWGHAERGEERFETSWNREHDVVRYDVVAFSRTAHAIAKIGAPIARRLQLRFQRESVAVMRLITAPG